MRVGNGLLTLTQNQIKYKGYKMKDTIELVNSLNRGQLVQLAFFIKKGIPNCDLAISKMKNLEIKQFIFDSQVTAQEITDFFDSISDKDDSKEAESKIKEIEQENSKASKSSVNPSDLRALVAEMRKKALETVIVTYSPNNTRDIEAGKTAETFFVENRYFQVAKVVPFNVPCEVPRCIAQNIQEALAPVYLRYEEDVARRAKKLGEYRMVPKYNVRVQEKHEFVK